MASVRRPSTVGKIEAFHKAYVCDSGCYPAIKGSSVTRTMNGQVKEFAISDRITALLSTGTQDIRENERGEAERHRFFF